MNKLLFALFSIGLTSTLNAFALDTSGCSTAPVVRRDARVEISALKPPRSSCWNIQDSGLQARYYWTQENNPRSERGDIGFWISLNGKTAYAKARSYDCRPVHRGGYGKDTGGRSTFVCTAAKIFSFREYPELLVYAYAPNGSPNYWDVAAAVSLDDRGNWDSRYGANYQFRF